ncbi:hypothetical protein A1O3_06985 [Capronia epimyces CBS 606.96]|uniref:Uncharacterized protein n=1 Tax=Capronia epimyces CBS 606.96 TaxID=1182542 RepID=W9XUL5_9EURO|nr:uncharacterized protein A1O3_06985 [Capronia epimyces CBS 606.96]EXJ80701.1 hypothetical protein A1O3_06985 [Capronia epimyces CBS 606.96]
MEHQLRDLPFQLSQRRRLDPESESDGLVHRLCTQILSWLVVGVALVVIFSRLTKAILQLVVHLFIAAIYGLSARIHGPSLPHQASSLLSASHLLYETALAETSIDIDRGPDKHPPKGLSSQQWHLLAFLFHRVSEFHIPRKPRGIDRCTWSFGGNGDKAPDIQAPSRLRHRSEPEFASSHDSCSRQTSGIVGAASGGGSGGVEACYDLSGYPSGSCSSSHPPVQLLTPQAAPPTRGPRGLIGTVLAPAPAATAQTPASLKSLGAVLQPSLGLWYRRPSAASASLCARPSISRNNYIGCPAPSRKTSEPHKPEPDRIDHGLITDTTGGSRSSPASRLTECPAGENGQRNRGAAPSSGRAAFGASISLAGPAGSKRLLPQEEDVHGGSDDQQESDSNLESAATEPRSKKSRVAEFRCPKWAANPNACHGSKCADWHNSKIAAVTRHVLLTDARNEPDTTAQIKKLSHSKLSKVDRWQKYYIIFGGQDPEQMWQPYWMQEDTADPVNQALLGLLAAQVPHDAGVTLEFLHKFTRLDGERKKRDGWIATHHEARKTALLRQLEEERRAAEGESQAQFEEEVQSLLHEFKSSGNGNGNGNNRPSLEEPQRSEAMPAPRHADAVPLHLQAGHSAGLGLSSTGILTADRTVQDETVGIGTTFDNGHPDWDSVPDPHDPTVASSEPFGGGGPGQGQHALRTQVVVTQVVEDAERLRLFGADASQESETRSQPHVEHHQPPSLPVPWDTGLRHVSYPALNSDSGYGSQGELCQCSLHTERLWCMKCHQQGYGSCQCSHSARIPVCRNCSRKAKCWCLQCAGWD